MQARTHATSRSWELHARRTSNDSAAELHYRRAESIYCRGGGVASAIDFVEYHYNPTLEARFLAKHAEYDARFGAGQHTVLYAFHGTSSEANLESILRDGLLLSHLGDGTRSRGHYGCGIYFSETAPVAQLFCAFNERMLVCKLLMGRPCQVAKRSGRALEPEFTSHVKDANGTEIVIYDEACILPVYTVKRRCLEPNILSGAPLVTHRDALMRLGTDGDGARAPPSKRRRRKEE